jgi:hypothetical protein
VSAAVGILLASMSVRRGHRYGSEGLVPRILARLSLLAFLVLGLAILFSVPQIGTALDRSILVVSADWRLDTVTRLTVVGCTLLGLSVFGNYVLGVVLRRRNASTELRRRTERVVRESVPPSDSRSDVGK